MNTQLVESIVQLIKSLTPEEQALIQAKLHYREDNEHGFLFGELSESLISSLLFPRFLL